MNKENNNEIFQCICGKQFEKQTSLISHKSHCKIYQESVKEEKLKRIQEKESKRLSNGMFKCENPDCGKEHDGSYASGRFCCKECSKHYIALTKINAKNPNVKAHLDKLRTEGKIQSRAPYGTWKCKICNFIADTRAKLNEHIKKEHYNQPLNFKNSNQEKLKCPFCGKKYNKSQQLGGHIINCKMHPNKAYYDEVHKQQGKTFSEKCKINPHYNGWLGRKHKKETKEKISKSTINRVFDANHNYCRQNIKYYSIKNILNEEYTVHGKWELNVAKTLNKQNIIWNNKTYLTYITDIQRTYHPDFYLPELNTYIEVKGYYSEDDKIKMKAVLKSNPDIKIYFISGINKTYQNFIAGKITFSDKFLMHNFI